MHFLGVKLSLGRLAVHFRRRSVSCGNLITKFNQISDQQVSFSYKETRSIADTIVHPNQLQIMAMRGHNLLMEVYFKVA